MWNVLKHSTVNTYLCNYNLYLTITIPNCSHVVKIVKSFAEIYSQCVCVSMIYLDHVLYQSYTNKSFVQLSFFWKLFCCLLSFSIYRYTYYIRLSIKAEELRLALCSTFNIQYQHFNSLEFHLSYMSHNKTYLQSFRGELPYIYIYIYSIKISLEFGYIFACL